MPEFASDAGELTDRDASRGLARRRFLTFLVTAPALTVAARVGAEVLTPARADAVVPSPPLPADVADFGDVMTALTRADTDLFVLQVSPDNRIRFEVPRAEVGQGITTAMAMIAAEELDARWLTSTCRCRDARPELARTSRPAGRTRCTRCTRRCARSRRRPGPGSSPRPRSGGRAGATLTHPRLDGVAPDGRTATYGSLTAAAAQVLIPAVSLGPETGRRFTRDRPADRPRLDARDIVTGQAQYALDLAVAGARRPSWPGRRRSAARCSATTRPRRGPCPACSRSRRSRPASRSPRRRSSRRQAAPALAITWDPGNVGRVRRADPAKLSAAIAPFAVPPLLAQYVEATFDFAFVTHAPLEVLSASPTSASNSAEIWLPTKSPIAAPSPRWPPRSACRPAR